MEKVSIADAKARFSELVNRVAYGHEQIVITKRGKPVAVLSNPSAKGLGSVKGWLNRNDPFLKEMEQIESRRRMGQLRIHRALKRC